MTRHEESPLATFSRENSRVLSVRLSSSTCWRKQSQKLRIAGIIGDIAKIEDLSGPVQISTCQGLDLPNKQAEISNPRVWRKNRSAYLGKLCTSDFSQMWLCCTALVLCVDVQRGKTCCVITFFDSGEHFPSKRWASPTPARIPPSPSSLPSLSSLQCALGDRAWHRVVQTPATSPQKRWKGKPLQRTKGSSTTRKGESGRQHPSSRPRKDGKWAPPKRRRRGEVHHPQGKGRRQHHQKDEAKQHRPKRGRRRDAGPRQRRKRRKQHHPDGEEKAAPPKRKEDKAKAAPHERRMEHPNADRPQGVKNATPHQ